MRRARRSSFACAACRRAAARWSAWWSVTRRRLHSNGAHLVLTELSDRIYEQLTKTETIELIGIDRAYRAEPEFFAATRKAVREAQKHDQRVRFKSGAAS